ncbi:phage portal protein [Paraburkholderia sediminicola]|uniref:phage portal protein n=1 Tax=Paraburkholderia sediminicola TaxID=458836 RepID=UPI0038BCAC08
MSAHAYIQYADVPDKLTASSHQHVDSVTGAKIITFDGCPLAGQLDTVNGRIQIEYPFPRGEELRNHLVRWLMQWGIHFTVVM